MTFGAQQTAPGRPPHKSRARKLLPLGVALWVVLEIWLLTLVAGAAGGFTVFLLLAAGVVAGSYVIKRAGRRAWKRLTVQLQSGGAVVEPAPESGGNGLTMLGGLLIILPGLLSDVAGLLCLFPPTRSLLRKGLERRLVRPAAAVPGAFGPVGDAFQQARMRMPDGKVVQGEVVREDVPPASREGAPREGGPQLPR
ncbi:FxsA family membrane protein [Streptomyces sp. UNOC14_S4]|uniref:FxsA family membrane protein n=1 Tax=Streptomyces sp. UNOC14_S4 TaxID=2872340 RepID=UPI001E2B0EEB|nr:FxsA family membrane protein [Streptomyces sp. UNOC14_S4]MCC3772353.1 FxsA family protein [Streptomyces sp. UNOC14_S4]